MSREAQEKKIVKQGVPVITPIDQAAVVKAILTDSKVSDGLYNAKRFARTEGHRIQQTSIRDTFLYPLRINKSLSRLKIRLFDALYSTLIFLPYSVIIKVVGVRLPAHLCGCCERRFSGGRSLFIYALTLLSRTISAAASGLSAVASISFAMFSRNWLSSAVVISAISSLPFVRAFVSLPYMNYNTLKCYSASLFRFFSISALIKALI